LFSAVQLSQGLGLCLEVCGLERGLQMTSYINSLHAPEPGDTGDMYPQLKVRGQAMLACLSCSHTHSCKYLVSQHKERERQSGGT